MLNLIEKYKIFIKAFHAKHWMNIPTFPHHKHVGSDVVESTETTLDDVLFIICDTGPPARDQ